MCRFFVWSAYTRDQQYHSNTILLKTVYAAENQACNLHQNTLTTSLQVFELTCPVQGTIPHLFFRNLGDTREIIPKSALAPFK